MKKCCSLLILVLVIGLVMADNTAPTSLTQLNQAIETQYHLPNYFLDEMAGVGLFNTDVLKQYQVPVYGKPHGDTKAVNGVTMTRFLGYAENGESIPTPGFPVDTPFDRPLRELNWIEDPWKVDEVKALPRFKNIKNTYFDDDTIRAALKASFLYSLDQFIADKQLFDLTTDADLPWERYYHVIVPPTEHTHGVAVLFHNLGGKIWYLEMTLAPFDQLTSHVTVKYCDLDGNLIAPQQVIEQTETLTVKAAALPNMTYRGYGYSTSEQLPALTEQAAQLEIAYSAFQQHYVVFYYEPEALADITQPDGDIVISSDIFDVGTAIPTGETVDIRATVEQPVIFDYRTRAHSGSETYTVVVSKPYTYYWQTAGGTFYHSPPCQDSDGDGIDDTCPGHYEAGETFSQSATSTTSYTVERPYLYHTIDALYHFELASLSVENNKLSILDPVTLSLADGDFVAPALELEQYQEHLKAPDLSGASYDAASKTYHLTLPSSSYPRDDIPNFDFTAYVESALSPIGVRNDYVKLGDNVLLDGAWSAASGASPLAAPVFLPITLSYDDFLLRHTLRNGTGQTTGTLHYNRVHAINSTETLDDIVINGNAVTIHTPVVDTSELLTAVDFDQRPNNQDLPQALPIDHIVAFNISTVGQHITAPGYNLRDYSVYSKFKRISFPFDVYYSFTKDDFMDNCHYLAKNTWQVIPFEQNTVYIKVPHWADTGDYEVLSQVVALNHGARGSAEARANLDLSHDVAFYRKPVSVTGRLFDFVITGCDDPLWRPLFKQSDTVYFGSGSNNKNGMTSNRSKAEGGSWPYTLPLAPGKQTMTGYQNIAIKPGYKVFFSVKSMGSFYNKDDILVIKFNFFHIDDEGNRTPVDLYYLDKDGKYVLVGSKNDRQRYLDIMALQPHVTQLQLQRTEDAIKAIGNKNYGGRTDTYAGGVHTKKEVSMAGLIAIGEYQRIFIGKTTNLPPGVDANHALRGVQGWYASYLMPNNILVFAKDSDIAEAYKNGQDISIKDGYIAVNATIELRDSNDYQKPHLAFVTDQCNEWQLEGYDPNYVSGDIAYYYVNKRASDDYKIK